METFLIFTSAAEHLAEKLKHKPNNSEFIFPEKNKEGRRFFPDEEIYTKIPGIKKLKKISAKIFY